MIRSSQAAVPTNEEATYSQSRFSSDDVLVPWPIGLPRIFPVVQRARMNFERNFYECRNGW